MRAVGFVEIDPWCRRVLARHWPEVAQHDDVRTAIQWWARVPRPRVDVVAGGYPCQGESSAGKRLGVLDHRWLWPEMARLVAWLRPRYVIGENVAAHRTQGLRFVLRDLERLGYTARAGFISAEEMGAPHRRKRIITLAELANPTGRCHADESLRGDGASLEIGALAGAGGRRAEILLSDTPGNGWGAGRSGGSPALGTQRRNGFSTQELANAGSEGRRTWRGHGPGGVPTSEVAGGQDERGVAERRAWWASEPDVGRVAHGVPARVDRLRGLGNAVVPAVGEYVGRLLVSGAWRDV